MSELFQPFEDVPPDATVTSQAPSQSPTNPAILIADRAALASSSSIKKQQGAVAATASTPNAAFASTPNAVFASTPNAVFVAPNSFLESNTIAQQPVNAQTSLVSASSSAIPVALSSQPIANQLVSSAQPNSIQSDGSKPPATSIAPEGTINSSSSLVGTEIIGSTSSQNGIPAAQSSSTPSTFRGMVAVQAAAGSFIGIMLIVFAAFMVRRRRRAFASRHPFKQQNLPGLKSKDSDIGMPQLVACYDTSSYEIPAVSPISTVPTFAYNVLPPLPAAMANRHKSLYDSIQSIPLSMGSNNFFAVNMRYSEMTRSSTSSYDILKADDINRRTYDP